MALSKEFLKIYEEEMSKEELRNPPTQLFFRAPPIKKEKIPEFTAEGKVVWPTGREERKLTAKEMEALEEMQETRLLRQTGDLGDRAEAFVQGLLPVGDKDVLEKAFPLSNLGGKVTRYALSSQVIASKFPGMVSGVSEYLAKPMQPLAHLMGIAPEWLADPVTSVLWSKSFPRMAAFATQRALTWGANELGENIVRGVTGDDLNMQKLLWEPAVSAGVGGVMGGVHGIANLWASSLVAAGIGGGREAVEKYLKDGNLGKEDIGDILLQAGLYGMVEAIGHKQVHEMFDRKEMQDFMYNKWYARLIGQGQTPEEAKLGATIATSNTGPFFNTLKQAAYERMIKPNLPTQVTEAKEKAADEIVNHAIRYFSSNKLSPSSVIGDIVGKNLDNATQAIMQAAANIKTEPERVKELPVFDKYLELPAPKSREGLSTYGQMRYGKALEEMVKANKIFDQQDIDGIKEGKSFSYQKENAMTDREAAEVIATLEDAIEIAEQFEGPQYKKTLKEMELLRQKYLGAKEKGVFADVVRSAMPEELQSMSNKEWTFLDWIRPSWRAFRKDPIMWNHGYTPVSNAYGLKERFVNTSITEARRKVKDLGLTAEDRRMVTIKRHTDYFISQGQKDLTPVTLTEKQAEWDGWLTKQFEGLHGFFRVDKMIPFQQYMPYLEDMENTEQSYLNELFPEYLPKNITAFFEKRRQSREMKKDKFREDSLDLYEMYIRAGAKKKYMLPAIREARRYVLQNPQVSASMKAHFQDWGTWMMGYPSLADNSFAALFENQGLSYEHAHMVTRFLMDLVYMGGIGFRPMSAIRNAFQDLNTACELGYIWTLAGYKDFMLNGGTSRAKQMGVTTEYLPELYSEFGKYNSMQKLRDASLFMFRLMDEKNRSVAYYAAENKFNHYYKQYGATDQFYQKSGINFTDKVKRAQIKDLIRNDKINEARHEFGKEIVAKTQYLYNKENSPLIQKTIGGKMVFQFKSWPENYGELISDWGRNKNYTAFMRAMLAYSVLGFLGDKMNQKWLTKTIPLGALPVERWKFEKNLVPAVLGPWIDLLSLFGATGMTWLETQDINKTSQTFERELKRLGKDILLYIPGGLAMKDFFKISGIIPKFSFSGGQQYQQPKKEITGLKFKKIGEGKGLKFKKF